MKRLSMLCLLLCSTAVAAAAVAEPPQRGQFLVADRELRSPAFAESVVLLLHYDESGALGLVVNRPTRIPPAELLPELEGLDAYRGRLYLGGPVEPELVQVLLRTDDPPPRAIQIVPGVHLAPLDEALLDRRAVDASRLRLYLGYAGWAPGQLDAELARGDWHLRAGRVDQIFAENPAGVWQELVPPRLYRAAVH